MTMSLDGIEAPNVIHANALADNISDLQDRDRFDVILANPPFGGKERKEVQQNFPVRPGETAFLFLQHFIKSLKAGGRAAIVIKNTFLSNTDNASTSIRKRLLEGCKLHTVLDMPGGTFQGAGVKTVVLSFEKDAQWWARRVRPLANDVVFSYETRVGQAAIIPPGLDCCLGRRMGLVRFRHEAVEPRCFLYQYLAPRFQNSRRAGVARENLAPT